MKLTFILLTTIILQASANSFAQNITLRANNSSLKQIFKEIHNQVKYDILYNSEDLKLIKPISLNVNNKPLEEVLKLILKDSPLIYKINNSTVLITKKKGEVLAELKIDLLVKGTILDDEGLPLPGVSVKIKGTNVGVVSDINGKYTIKVPNSESVLQFSFIGFNVQEVKAGTKAEINIKLLPKINELNEVRVLDLGFGNLEKREDLTGAIGSVSVKDLQKAPVSNFEEALAGRIAGVQVLSNDGQPGDGFNIVIRGASSINNSNSPLYVIDGLPIEDPNNNNLNTDDIESITILKDASSTAIYGSRAANGVVIITTKQGKAGPTRVTYNTFYGNNITLGRIDLMNAAQFVNLQFELDSTYTNTYYFNKSSTTGLPLNANRPIYSLSDYENTTPLDFQDRLFVDAPFVNHNLSISGGNDKGTKFLFSGNYQDKDGVILNSGFKRYQGRLNLDQKISEKIKVTANLNYTSSESYGSFPRNQESSSSLLNTPVNNLLYRVWVWRPTSINFIDDDEDVGDDIVDREPGAESTAGGLVNPFISVMNQYNSRKVNNFSASTITNYNITKNLSYRLNASASITNNRIERFDNERTNSGRSSAYGPNGSLSLQQQNNFSIENILTFKKFFKKKTTLNIIALSSQQWKNVNSTALSATQVTFTNQGVYGLPSGFIQPDFGVDGSDANLLGFGTTANLNFRNKYVFKASFRADGSSKFAPGNRWGFFPSAGFAWKVSEEKFMKNVEAVSNVKFRINYGETGNNRVSDFPYLSPISFTNTSAHVYNNTYYPGYFQTALGNRELKWETTAQFDTGLEFGIVNNKINIEMDYYRKNTRDLLLNANFPVSSGFTRGLINVGKIMNQGFEFTLNAAMVNKKNFKWFTNFNIAFNKNQVIELADGAQNIITIAETKNTTPNYLSQIGQSIGLFYGFTYAGVYQYSDFDKLPSGVYALKDNVIAPNGGLLGFDRTQVQPGDPKYQDINGDGFVDDSDQGIIGQSNPKAIGGYNNNFTYKNFDLNLFFQWSYGGQNLNMNKYYLENATTRGLNQFASYENRWKPDNPSDYAPRAGARGTLVSSSRIIEDSSFIRFKTVQLAYSLPQKLTSKLGLKTFKLNTSVQNLWTITNYSGTDPEVNTLGTGLSPAYEFSAYPRALTYTLGLNVSL